jgi:hypothetical protein
MRKLTGARETGFTQTFTDSTTNYDIDCSEYVCYSVKPDISEDIAAGTEIKFLIVGTQNQISQTTLGNWFVQTQVSLSSWTEESTFNNID